MPALIMHEQSCAGAVSGGKRTLVGKQDAAPYTQHDDIPWLRLLSWDPQAFSSQQLSMKGLPAASFFSKNMKT